MTFFSVSFLIAVLFSPLTSPAHAQLSPAFYTQSCPNLETTVRSVMAQAVANDPRSGAFVLRLFFHDCFVNGCDASVLLDDTPTFQGEKLARPNANSLHGFDIIEAVKGAVEEACQGTVSCADIVALAARDAVNLLGGPSWAVPLGRRDATWANQSAADSNIPRPDSSIGTLVSMFAAQGLSVRDMTALSGAHTVGKARCSSFRTQIYCDADISPDFAALCQQTCPTSGGDGNLSPLDVQTPTVFDNAYYQNLVGRAGLLHSDQSLFDGGPVGSLVQLYSKNAAAFASDFVAAMVKMGSISPLTGSDGEIRFNCSRVNVS